MLEDTQPTRDTDPLRELVAFHGRIRLSIARLKELSRLPPALVDVHDARALVTFFRGPLLWHDMDEEAVLMPALRARAHSMSGAPVVDDLTRACSRAHERLEGVIDEILPHLDDVADGRAPSDPARLAIAAAALEDVLFPHLSLEEREIFPLARRLLAPRDLADIAEAMAARLAARRARSTS